VLFLFCLFLASICHSWYVFSDIDIRWSFVSCAFSYCVVVFFLVFFVVLFFVFLLLWCFLSFWFFLFVAAHTLLCG